MYASDRKKIFSPAKAKLISADCREQADRVMDGQLCPEAQARFMSKLYSLGREEAAEFILGLICNISLRFIEAGDDATTTKS